MDGAQGELPWRAAFLASAGVVSVVSGQIAAWDAAAYRSEDIDPQVWAAVLSVLLVLGRLAVAGRD